jgi:hypothetical protein
MERAQGGSGRRIKKNVLTNAKRDDIVEKVDLSLSLYLFLSLSLSLSFALALSVNPLPPPPTIHLLTHLTEPASRIPALPIPNKLSITISASLDRKLPKLSNS